MHKSLVLKPGEVLYVGYLQPTGRYQEIKIVAVDDPGDEDIIVYRNPATTVPGQARTLKLIDGDGMFE
jgi:hypothetical protein